MKRLLHENDQLEEHELTKWSSADNLVLEKQNCFFNENIFTNSI